MDYIASDSEFATVADAIRTKGGTSASLEWPSGFASAVAAIPSGGGLTSVVRGSFKYTAAGWNTISVPYSGSGYPIGVIIWVKDGIGDGTYATTLRRYSIGHYMVFKDDVDATQTYDGTIANHAEYTYKNSTSDASVQQPSSSTLCVFNTDEPTSNGAGYAFRISADKTIKVRTVVVGTSTSRYGFLANVDYEYLVIYSS